MKWNKVYNLTSIRNPDEVLTHHILDSLSIIPVYRSLHPDPITVMDVYSKWSQETFGMYVEPYMCDFVDEYISNTVQKDTRNQMRLIEIFMLLAVMISLLGLVAMSTYFSESQSKDIAVRKVYGGTVGSETVRYVSNYMAMVLSASVIGVPLAVWAAQLYLRRFTYRIEDWWWIPVVAVLISLGISLCAVLWQTLRAAHTDPAKALKKE